ncbi:class I SAM-dependent methyltransferase [Dyadobacter sandarakinus]|uniref:Class I SAM-dependent methyltransferase n=1 Tax=Dyadobacter sandarakinus TaxID=2747268 RepID=A0ABX7I4F7_9BACT|nr:class I SAM-dependent methyltransferase [Dyadobacter sandarakinus]QRR00387.1 class I SAM-dependent methyltransferase [Dyadobacter sandarakinus]
MPNFTPVLDDHIAKGHIVCPLCFSRLENSSALLCTNIACEHHVQPLPVIQQKIPILVDFRHTILDKQKLLATAGESLIPRSHEKYSTIKRIFWGSGRSTKRNLTQFSESLPRRNAAKSLILVIGGGAVGTGAAGLYQIPQTEVLSFDIYASPHTDFIADGHSLPIADNSVDGIWIQAVLEHVMYPHKVASEILRVLRPGGIVYAETPFMQFVHEGPYDFTRFTESGHRLLFKDFKRIDSGFSTGIGTVLLWNVRYLAWGVTRNKKLAIAISLLFSWLRVFDRLVPASFNADTASGVYFLGQKDPAYRFSDQDIIAHYQGYQQKRS